MIKSYKKVEIDKRLVRIFFYNNIKTENKEMDAWQKEVFVIDFFYVFRDCTFAWGFFRIINHYDDDHLG